MSNSEDWSLKYRTDPRSSDELLNLALTKDMDTDNEEFWHPVRSLHYRLPTIIDRVEELLRSSDPKSRDTAATILGQNSLKEKWAVSRCVDLLLSAIQKETSVDVLPSIIHALGNLQDLKGVEAVLPFAKHPDSDVRYAVVHSISGHVDQRAIHALIQLSSDPDRDVRNWATYGLGSQIETDTTAVREALLARLEEDDVEIRGEGLVGLARRGDARVVTPLLHELATTDPDSLRNGLAIDAANAIVRLAEKTGAPTWLPVLEKLHSLEISDSSRVTAAITRCTSGPT